MSGGDQRRTLSTICTARSGRRSFPSSFCESSIVGRIRHGRPDDISSIQKLAAHATHSGLYALLIVQPFTGWIATSAYRAPVVVFGLFELPPIWRESRAFSEQLFFVHGLIGIAIACLVAAHIGAALYHHFVRRDRVLLRMITG